MGNADRARSSRTAGLIRSPYFLPALAIGLAAVNLYWWFPGALNADSEGQYQQALSGHLNDWQPPLMARLWILLRPITSAPWPLFVLNTILFWAGFAFIAQGLVSRGRRRLAFLMLLSGASPLFIFFNREIITDAGLASGLIAAFGIAFFFRVQRKPVPAPFWPLLASTLLYATLVRSNALFAVPPVILYAFGVRPASKISGWLLCCCALGIALIPATIVTNRLILGASEAGGMQRLQIFDIVGVGYRSGDDRAIREAAGFVPKPLSNCYTPLLWDTLTRSQCASLWYRLPPPGSAARARISGLWIGAIARHPVAYAVHRLQHFNLETFFMVPAAAQCVSAPELHDCGQNEAESGRVMGRVPVGYSDYLLKNPLVWPITWLALGALMLLSSRSLPGETVSAARILLASGLIYGIAYLFIGIAMNVRYFYWTILAVQTSAIMILPHHVRAGGKRELLLIAAGVSVVIITGYVFRIGDIDLLVR